jgi:acetyl esterase/lipase
MFSHPCRVSPPITIGPDGGRARRGGRAARAWTLERLEERSLLSAGHGRGQDAAGNVLHAEGILRSHPATRGGAEVANLVYESVNGRQEQLDLYLPGGTPPAGGWPVLIAIHGGGWRRFDKTEYGSKVAPMFTRSGIAVVAMNYKLSAPGAPSWPANFEDVRNAVRWTRVNADRYGLNPDRTAAIGESAGGHLAALLGTNPDGAVTAGGDPEAGSVYGSVSARVGAVVDFYGPTSLAALDAESPEAAPAIEQFLGGKPDQVPRSYDDASPVNHVTAASAPMLILQGTADTLITPDQPLLLAQALSAAGVANRVITVPGAPHGFEFQPSGRKLMPEILAFLHNFWQG